MLYGNKPWVALGIATVIALAASTIFYFVAGNDFGSSVLVGTAVLIAWYSLETNLLRRATEATIEIQQTPFLALNVHEDNSRMHLTVENIGAAIARHIRFTPFTLGDTSYMLHLDDANDFLYPAKPGQGRVQLDLIVQRDTGARLMESRYEDLYRHVSTSGPVLLTVHYRNPVGGIFHSVYRFSARLSVVFTPMLEFVAAGAGDINRAQAEQLASELDRTLPSIILDNFISESGVGQPRTRGRGV
jgi:hypothetical protein